MAWIVNTKLWHSNEFLFAKTECWLKITRIAFWTIYHVYVTTYHAPRKSDWITQSKWQFCEEFVNGFFTRESLARKQEFNKTLNIFWKRFFARPLLFFHINGCSHAKNVFLKRGITFKVFIYNTISSLDKWKFICSRKPALFQKSLLILH